MQTRTVQLLLVQPQDHPPKSDHECLLLARSPEVKELRAESAALKEAVAQAEAIELPGRAPIKGTKFDAGVYLSGSSNL